MHLTYSQEKLSALMGEKEPTGDLDWKLAAHVIDGLLENDDNGGYGFSGWTADLAVETYADEHFLKLEAIRTGEVDWSAVKSAVSAALRVLAYPAGFILVNQNDGHVWAYGSTLDEAKLQGLPGF